MRWGGFGLGRCALVGAFLEPVTASGYGDDFGAMEQSVQDGAGGRRVRLRRRPALQRDTGARAQG